MELAVDELLVAPLQRWQPMWRERAKVVAEKLTMMMSRQSHQSNSSQLPATMWLGLHVALLVAPLQHWQPMWRERAMVVAEKLTMMMYRQSHQSNSLQLPATMWLSLHVACGMSALSRQCLPGVALPPLV